MIETTENIQTQESADVPQQEAQPQHQQTQTAPVPFEISVLPLQQTTLFPETVVPLAVGRSRSIAAVESALATEEKLLACITIRTDNVTGADATSADLYSVGTLVMIKRMMRDEEHMQIIVQGTERIRVLEWRQEQPHLRARVEILPELEMEDPEEVEAIKRNVQGLIQQALAMLPQVPPEVRAAVMSASDPVRLAYFLASILNLGVEQEQRML